MPEAAPVELAQTGRALMATNATFNPHGCQTSVSRDRGSLIAAWRCRYRDASATRQSVLIDEALLQTATVAKLAGAD